MTYVATITRPELLRLAKRCFAAKSLRGAVRILVNFRATLPQLTANGTWCAEFGLLIDALRTGSARYRVFVHGNGKLPWYAFSTLPIVTCPGAGECAKWCYSFKAWQHTGGYLRQLQNTLLLRFAPDVVADAFLALPANLEIRLYVDGDFESTARVTFWMTLIRKRADLAVYGYSKSWASLLEFHKMGGSWPENYALNLSTGGQFDELPRWITAMQALPITRGRYVTVPIDGTDLPRGVKRYDSPIYHSRVREALREKFGKRVASCPGKCGECGSDKHWCGDRKLHDLTIGIGIH